MTDVSMEKIQYSVYSIQYFLEKQGESRIRLSDRFAIEREREWREFSLQRERERKETKEPKERHRYEGDARERGRRRGEKKRAKEES